MRDNMKQISLKELVKQTVPISFFIWGQERTGSGVRISSEGTNCSPFVKPEVSQMF